MEIIGERRHRAPLRAAALLVLTSIAVCSAADREWQKGKCTDVGLTHDVFLGNAGRREPGGIGRTTIRPATPPVATYVIETDDLRLELRDVVPIGPGSLRVTVGDEVTFALRKNTIYIRDDKGTEHRLRVVKKAAKGK